MFTLKELLTITCYDTKVIVYKQNVMYFPTEENKTLIFIGLGRDCNYQGFDEVISDYGKYIVRRVNVKDDYLEISIYVEED